MRQRPHVLLSAAMSADGYIDDASATRLVLSDDADLDRVDELRARSDAILVGAHTIRADNPSLRVRSPARQDRRTERGLAPSPRKVTMTRTGDLDPRARFFVTAAGEPPLVYAARAVAGELGARLSAAAVVVPLPAAAADAGIAPGAGDAAVPPGAAEEDLTWILTDLAARGVDRLMVEGGAKVLGQFLAAGLADEFLLAVAPIFVADPAAPRLLAGTHQGGRMTLAEVTQTGDMAVLRYLPGTGEPG